MKKDENRKKNWNSSFVQQSKRIENTKRKQKQPAQNIPNNIRTKRIQKQRKITKKTDDDGKQQRFTFNAFYVIFILCFISNILFCLLHRILCCFRSTNNHLFCALAMQCNAAETNETQARARIGAGFIKNFGKIHRHLREFCFENIHERCCCYCLSFFGFGVLFLWVWQAIRWIKTKFNIQCIALTYTFIHSHRNTKTNTSAQCVVVLVVVRHMDEAYVHRDAYIDNESNAAPKQFRFGCFLFSFHLFSADAGSNLSLNYCTKPW